MQLTKRDGEMMGWLNGFGYAQIKHIAVKLKTSEKTAYRRMQKLVREGYCQHDRLWFGEPGVYRLTAKGVGASNDELPQVRAVNVAQAKHQLAVISLSLHLEKTSTGHFIPERQLRRCLGLTGVGQSQHVCDGVWVQDGKQFAIEVELSNKGKRRLDNIIRHYKKAFNYEEVWYFCGDKQVRKKVEAAANEVSFIKFYNLTEWLAHAVR